MDSSRRSRSACRLFAAFLLGAAWLAPVAAADKVSPFVREAAKSGQPVEVLIRVAGDAGLAKTPPSGTFTEKTQAAYRRLRAVADSTQRPLLAELRKAGIPHRAFWVANVVWAKPPAGALDRLAARADVAGIDANPRIVLQPPIADGTATAPRPKAVEWGVARVRAPEAWALGFRGQGVVVAAQDTGYQWDHPALRASYRGWDGVAASHDYHWHDAIHALVGGGGNPCGLDSSVPCDDNGHGTHTLGTMVGDDGGANQIGVAPAARWIACRNMERGNGTPATYIECFQFFLAPSDATGANPDPARAPHIINNSWGCPPSEGCSPATLQAVVDNVRAAGILVVVSAGNSGDACGSVVDPPAIYAGSFSVGAITSSDAIADFSSRGPVTVDLSNRLKPDIAAPGAGIRSSVRGSGYASLSGTSMAGPHVAAVAALVMSANPDLRGNPAAVEAILRETAIPTTSAQTCGTFSGASVPNAVFGHGRIDALAAVQRAFAEILLFRDGFEPAP
jgi:subtilisin family serine protease